MKPEQDLYDVTANVLLGLRGVLSETKPDMALVHHPVNATILSELADCLSSPPYRATAVTIIEKIRSDRNTMVVPFPLTP